MYKMNLFNLKKIKVTESLRLKLKKSLLISKDICYNKYILFKIKKSDIYRRYIRKSFSNRKLSFKNIKQLMLYKQRTKFTYKKLFRNKSYKNIRSNIFQFQNAYHKYKFKTINIF